MIIQVKTIENFVRKKRRRGPTRAYVGHQAEQGERRDSLGAKKGVERDDF